MNLNQVSLNPKTLPADMVALFSGVPVWELEQIAFDDEMERIGTVEEAWQPE